MQKSDPSAFLPAAHSRGRIEYGSDLWNACALICAAAASKPTQSVTRAEVQAVWSAALDFNAQMPVEPKGLRS